MAPKKRKLSDLYIVGRQVTLNDDSGEEPVVVWMQKLNAIESETCLRRAQAARSRVMAASRDRSGEEWHESRSELLDFSRETLVEMVIADEAQRISARVREEVAAEDKWTKEDFLQGLSDAFFGDEDDKGLQEVLKAADETDPRWDEAQKVAKEIKLFEDRVNTLIENEREALRRERENQDLDDLRDEATVRNLALRGDSAWIKDFRRSQLFFAVRDPENPKQRYFTSYEEVGELSANVLKELEDHFESLSVDPTEGKDLPPTTDSSQQSGQPDEAETVASSGPVVVNQ